MAKYFGKYANNDELKIDIMTGELLNPYVALTGGMLNWNYQSNNWVTMNFNVATDSSVRVFYNSNAWASISEVYVDAVQKYEYDFTDSIYYNFEAGEHNIYIQVYDYVLTSFGENSDMVSYKLPENINQIANYGISNCPNLETVELPRYCTAVGKQAFGNCPKLININVENLQSVGNNAFSNCTGLEELHFNNLNSLDYSPFNGCTSLTAVTFGDSMITVPGNSIFKGCSALESVVMPKNLNTLAGSTTYPDFYGCTALTAVTFPSTFINMSDGAFSVGCSNLSYVKFESDYCPSYGSDTWTSVADEGTIVVPIDCSANYAQLISDLEALGKTWTIVEE